MATDLEAASIAITEAIPQQEIWPISRLHPDPANMFPPLTDEELSDLAESIEQDGILNPITIRPDGTIIAGEQRYRTALRVGLYEVPVRVYDVSEQDAVRLQVSENYNRRNLKPSDSFRIILRLVESYGVALPAPGAGSRTGWVGLLHGIMSHVRDRTGLSERTIEERIIFGTTLVKELQNLWDEGIIGRELARQLCKLPEEYQRELATAFIAIVEDNKSLTKREYQEQFNTLIEQIKGLTDEKSSVEARLQEILENPPSIDDPRVKELEEELEELDERIQEYLTALKSKDEENKKLKEDLKFHEYINRSDKLNKAIKALCEAVSISPQECVERFTTKLGAELILKTHRSMLAKSVIPWLEEYVDEIDKMLGEVDSTRQEALEEGSVLHLPKSKVKRKGT